MADGEFPMTPMRVELVKVYIIEAPRFTTTKDGDKLMQVSVIKNPNPKAKDKDGDPRYISFRATVTVNVTKTPWKGKAQKGDPIYVSGNADARLYPSQSDKATLGVGLELEIPYPDRFELLVSKQELDSREGGEETQKAPAKARKKLGAAKKAAPEPEDDEELPEGLDD